MTDQPNETDNPLGLPWRTDEADHTEPNLNISICNCDGGELVQLWIDDAPEPEFNAQQRLIARHIVASANSTQGMKIERLEQVGRNCCIADVNDVIKEELERERLTAENARLVEALKLAVEWLDCVCDQTNELATDQGCAVHDKITAAIALAGKGGA